MLRQHDNRLSCVEKTLSLQSESRGVDARTEELAYSPERVTLATLTQPRGPDPSRGNHGLY